MHQKIIARLELLYVSGDPSELLSQTIKIGKNLSDHQVEASIIGFLANTDFSGKYNCHSFEYQCDSKSIKSWLQYCREQHEELTIEDPESDEYLNVGEFKIDHKYCQYALLQILYHKRYLENE